MTNTNILMNKTLYTLNIRYQLIQIFILYQMKLVIQTIDTNISFKPLVFPNNLNQI